VSHWFTPMKVRQKAEKEAAKLAAKAKDTLDLV
jgi:hypothetical protein